MRKWHIHPWFSRLRDNLGGPEQAVGEVPLGFGIVGEDKPYEFFMVL